MFTSDGVLLQFAKQMGVRTDKPEVMFRPEDVELRTSTPRLEEEAAWCAATVNDGALTENGYKFYLQLTPDMVGPSSLSGLDFGAEAFARRLELQTICSLPRS